MALIVDDSTDDRQLVTHLIENAAGLPLGIAAVSSAGEALAWIREHRPTIVISGMQLPDLDGISMVKLIHQEYPDMPVVLFTANGSEDLAIKAIRAGAASYIPKKYLDDELVSTLERIVELSVTEGRRQRLYTLLESRETRFSLRDDPELHAPLVGLLVEDLRCCGIFDHTARIHVGMAIQEALSNAMYHGNLEVSSDLRQDDERLFHALANYRRKIPPYADRRIHILARIERDSAGVTCTYTIRDEGPGFDTTIANRPLEGDDLMRIGGRGLLLIHAFMDRVIYNPVGNEITMIKRQYGVDPL